MISSGLFILPGLAFAKAGPAVLLSYVIAGFLTIPTLLSMAELTTAMPKAGGDYFYIMRGFGPLFGTIAGFSSWFSLSLKGAFALIGMGAYLSIITDLPLSIVALLCCLFFVFLNLIGVREAGRFQVVLVLGILVALFAYIVWGMKSVEVSKFTPFFSEGLGSVMATASFVFISYGGLNKVVALAEETRNPARNLPLGMILSILVVVTLYALVIFVAIGVSDTEGLKQDLTPISNSAGIFGGSIFKIIISVAAFFAFISTANAGIMTASRYPLSMSRDKILPASFQRVSSRFKTPYVSIVLTGAFMILAILFLKLELLVKVASSLLIILFIFANLTVILFRESKISSYRPKFRSSYYPYMQVFGVLSGGFLLIEMGSFTVFLTIAFIFLGFIWYKIYVQKRASQDSALIHVLERLVAKDRELNSEDLLVELKDIVFQRDDLVKDKFHHVIEEAQVLDLEEVLSARVFFKETSDVFAKETGLKSQNLFEKFIWREEASSTVIKEGLAIPHIFVEKKGIFKIILVRAKAGIVFPGDKVVHTAFVLVGSSGERVLHLKILAAIAQITQSPNFDKMWKEAKNGQELKSVVLLAERKREVR
ncbi:MAG: amino acid permease [Candidatus Omnitrophica bacterium]|nr:amino acid permease [Candidatus Omnitrophota bacterium]MCF7892282.1 amino acid permease [Candidatus Omnitrophota bacterium]MCF7895725.1 amino acid permease [Candidatus Omnitrophota bacterium]MCF7898275.1 amino acid permease [Candidatus Omnitrophota bacterium]MCF7909930.1 amino acid permease [Candidatus Omnitrophota bacterium]